MDEYQRVQTTEAAVEVASALDTLKDIRSRLPQGEESRELAIAITHLENGAVWLEHIVNHK